MSGLMAWLDERPAVPASSPSPADRVEWPGGISTADALSLALGLERAFAGEVFEEGDVASEGRELARLWVAAIRDHPRHGVNWIRKNGAALAAAVRVALPGLLPMPAEDRVVEGRALAQLALDVFPAAKQGPWQPRDVSDHFRQLVRATFRGEA